MLSKPQSIQCPLADSGIVILKDTNAVRKPVPDEMKVIAQIHHVSSYEL